MNRIRTLVVDDEPLAGKLIASYVEKTPFLELTDLCLDGASALHRIGEGKAELVFCDIQMPDLTGMELSRMASSPRNASTTSARRAAVTTSAKLLRFSRLNRRPGT